MKSLVDIQNEVLGYFQSKTLVTVIKKSNFIFDPIELCILINELAPTFEMRICHWEDIYNAINDENVRKKITRAVSAEKEAFKLFQENTEGYFFDVVTKETKSFEPSRYACRTYAEAVEMIECYANWTEGGYPNSRYIIEKRLLYVKPSIDFLNRGNNNETLGTSQFNNEGALEEVNLYTYHEPQESNCDDCEKWDCEDCEHLSIRWWRNKDIHYPKYLANYDLVRYKLDKNDSEYEFKYGVNVEINKLNPDPNAYILPLDNTSLYNGDFEEAIDAHCHIPYYLVDKIKLDEIDSFTKKIYLEYRAWCEGNGNKNKCDRKGSLFT